MGAHARLGASKAERWDACPGSIALSETVPEPPASEYAIEGSAAHELNELLFQDSGEALPEAIPVEIEWDPETGEPTQWAEVEVTEEMIEFGQEYVKICLSRADGHPYWVETKVNLNVLAARHGIEEDMFGTADFATFRPDGEKDGILTGVLEIVDYKYGTGIIVDVRENLQLIYYAIGMVVMLQTLMGQPVRPHTIVTTIYQPRVEHSQGPIRSWSYTWDELKEASQRLMAAAKRTQEVDAPLNAGDHCIFCPALKVCPEQQRLAETVAADNFSVIETGEEEASLSDEAAAVQFVLQYGSIIKKRIDTIFEQVRAHMEQGGEVPGYKLVRGRRNYEWSNEDDALKYLARKLGGKEVVAPRKLVTPAQARKMLKEFDNGHLTPRYHQLVDTKYHRPRVVPEDHHADALVTESTAQNEFQPITEGDHAEGEE